MSTNFDFCQYENFIMTSFVKTPYDLIFGKEYAKLSALAKFLLIIMLARFELSVKNGWADSNGNTYIILSHREAKDLLLCSESKIKKLYGELKDANIIKSKKQGLGKPNLIYINADMFLEQTKKSSQEDFDTPFLTASEKPSAESFKNHTDSFEKTSKYINNKYIKNNYINHINQSKEQTTEEMIEERKEYKEFIEELIQYNYLIDQKYNKRVIDGIVDTAVNMLCTKSPLIKIGKQDIPYEDVKRRIYKLDVNIVDEIYENLKKIRGNVKNPTGYLITTIYNAVDNACMGFA